MDKENSRVYDNIALICTLTLCPLFTVEFCNAIRRGGVSIWLEILFAALFITLLFFLTRVGTKSENFNIIVAVKRSLCTTAKQLYAFVLVMFFSFFASERAWRSAEVLKNTTFDLTPTVVLALFVLICAVILNLFGKRSLIKTCGFFFILIAFGIVFAILLTLNRLDTDNIFPLFSGNIEKNIVSSVALTSVFTPLLLLFIIKNESLNSKKTAKSGVLSIIITASAWIIFSLILIMTFTLTIASELFCGFIEIGKSCYFNHFFYRFESILLFFVIFVSTISTAVYIYASIICLDHLKMMNYRTRVLICTSITAIFFVFRNIFVDLDENFIKALIEYSAIYLFLLPILMIIVAKLIKNTVKTIKRKDS